MGRLSSVQLRWVADPVFNIFLPNIEKSTRCKIDASRTNTIPFTAFSDYLFQSDSCYYTLEAINRGFAFFTEDGYLDGPPCISLRGNVVHEISVRVSIL